MALSNSDKHILNALNSKTYTVDEHGNIHSSHYKKPIEGRVKGGYSYVNLYVNKIPKRVATHRVVAFARVRNPHPRKWPQINHKDGNKLNNHPSNLEWCDHARNFEHAKETGLMAHGDKHYLAKLDEAKVRQARRLYKARIGLTVSDLARRYGVDRNTMKRALTGEQWAHIKADKIVM